MGARSSSRSYTDDRTQTVCVCPLTLGTAMWERSNPSCTRIAYDTCTATTAATTASGRDVGTRVQRPTG